MIANGSVGQRSLKPLANANLRRFEIINQQDNMKRCKARLRIFMISVRARVFVFVCVYVCVCVLSGVCSQERGEINNFL